MFLIRNFSGFTGLGLTPQQIWAFSPELYRYISHLQVALSGYMLGIGILSIALAWYGIRRGERWALWTILLGPAITAAVALPLHYPYGLAGHSWASGSALPRALAFGSGGSGCLQWVGQGGGDLCGKEISERILLAKLNLYLVLSGASKPCIGVIVSKRTSSLVV